MVIYFHLLVATLHNIRISLKDSLFLYVCDAARKDQDWPEIAKEIFSSVNFLNGGKDLVSNFIDGKDNLGRHRQSNNDKIFIMTNVFLLSENPSGHESGGMSSILKSAASQSSLWSEEDFADSLFPSWKSNKTVGGSR